MDRTRIAFNVSTLDVGGAEQVMYDLLTGIDRDRFESRVYFLRKPGYTGEKIMAAGIACESGLQQARWDPSVLARFVPRLRKFAPALTFFLDHHNAIFWGGIASVLAGGRSHIIASHTTGRVNGKPSFTRSDHIMLRACRSVVALSESHANYLERNEGVDGRKITVIGNGVDVGRFENVDPDAVRRLRASLGLSEAHRTVIIVAALRPEKAHDVVLRSAQRLLPDYPSLRVLIVGEGRQRAALEQLTAELNLARTVRFLGRRNDVPELLQLADVLVLPSHPFVETQPVSILEAMASRVPVVASSVGSVPDMIENGIHGRLIAPADPDGLEKAIRDTLESPDTTAHIVEQAAKMVKDRFSVSKMVAHYEALFSRLASHDDTP